MLFLIYFFITFAVTLTVNMYIECSDWIGVFELCELISFDVIVLHVNIDDLAFTLLIY